VPLSTYQASNRELAAVAASVKVLGPELRKVLRERTRDDVVPLLMRAARVRARDKVAQRVVGTGRPNLYLGTPGVSFGGARRVAGTATGRQLARPVELGSDGRRWQDYLERRKGGTVSVLRRTTRQFMPNATDGGKVIYPAAVAVTDQVVAMWVGWVEDLSVAALSGEL
jgi:hypothetical protein